MRHTRTSLAVLAILVIGGGWIAHGQGTRPADRPDQPTAPDASLAEMLASKAVDLTYTFDDQTIYWPLDEPFHWKPERWGRKPDGTWYASAVYGGSEHGGTHLDSPIHFAEGQATTDQIPIDKLIGPAVVVDITDRCRQDRDDRAPRRAT